MELELTFIETLLANIHVPITTCKEDLEMIISGIPLGKDRILNMEHN